MALAEISYPMTWKLVEKNFHIGLVVAYDEENKGQFNTKNGASIETGYGRNVELKAPGSADYIEAVILAGYYSSPYHLARVIRDKLIEAKPNVLNKLLDVELDPVDKQITFTTSGSKSFMMFFSQTRDIPEILGFPPITTKLKLYGLVHKRKEGEQYKLTFVEDEARSTRPPHVFRSPALYVYSDIVEDEQVGDTRAPLLRTVHIDGTVGQTVNKEFERPYYKPVRKQYINSILVEIKDDTGRDIEFTSGKVICVLHFRRRGLAI